MKVSVAVGFVRNDAEPAVKIHKKNKQQLFPSRSCCWISLTNPFCSCSLYNFSVVLLSVLLCVWQSASVCLSLLVIWPGMLCVCAQSWTEAVLSHVGLLLWFNIGSAGSKLNLMYVLFVWLTKAQLKFLSECKKMCSLLIPHRTSVSKVWLSLTEVHMGNSIFWKVGQNVQPFCCSFCVFIF